MTKATRDFHKNRNVGRRSAKAAARAASERRMQVERLAVQAAVRENRCPDCGNLLRRNSSLTGWWQCVQFGAIGFRADPNAAQCAWQGFTE